MYSSVIRTVLWPAIFDASMLEPPTSCRHVMLARAMLYKKSRGSESKLSYLGHVLMENRNGLVVDTRLTRATGTAERDAALEMAARIPGGTRRVTLGGDKNYDTRDFVDQLRQAAVTPHVARTGTNGAAAPSIKEPRSTLGTPSVGENASASWRS